MTAADVVTVSTVADSVRSVPVVLERSRDRKVAGAVRRKPCGDDAAVVGNSFGLTAGPSASCAPWAVDFGRLEAEGLVTRSERRALERFHGGRFGSSGGATAACRGCYAVNLERARPAVANLVGRNWERVRPLEESGDRAALADMLGEVLDSHYREAVRVAERSGVPLERVAPFRAHWDGDIPGPNYAHALASAWAQRPHVRGWLYSRNPVALLILARSEGLDHVALFASVDRYNVAEWDAWLPLLGARVNVATLSDSHAAAVELAAAVGRRAVPCPETARRLPLVVGPSGRRSDVLEVGDTGMGACIACGLCVHGRGSVAFSTRKGPR